MANRSRVYLLDKDIRKLDIKEKRYTKSVGEPKELCIWVNPSGMKSFFLKYKDSIGKEIAYKLSDFREGIYSVNEARRDANKFLKILAENGNKNLKELEKNDKKYIFKTMFEEFINKKLHKETHKAILKE